jgi:hypothetical protein
MTDAKSQEIQLENFRLLFPENEGPKIKRELKFSDLLLCRA